LQYRRGYTGRDFHVTGGHEEEALAAERAEGPPNRFQRWILKVLGYKGPDPPPADHQHGHPHYPR
jgi:hypothetical protein